jgi:hypothetical protein
MRGLEMSSTDTLRDQQEHRIACERYEQTARLNEPSKLVRAWADQIGELMSILGEPEGIDLEAVAQFLQDQHDGSYEMGFEAGLDEGRAGY